MSLPVYVDYGIESSYKYGNSSAAEVRPESRSILLVSVCCLRESHQYLTTTERRAEPENQLAGKSKRCVNTILCKHNLSLSNH